MQRAVEEVADVVRGTVTIGTVASHAFDMPALLADFHADHPAVEITLSTDDSDALIENVRNGTLDAAIASVGPDETPEGLSVQVVTDQPIDAVVCHSDKLASRSRIPLTQLRERSLIALPVGTGIRRQLDAACAAAGFSPRVAFEAGTPEALTDLAERGLGVAIVPRSVSGSRDTLHAVAITPEFRGRLVLVWRSTGPLAPAARVLIDKARRLLRVGDAA
jgi:DNA-binding transcriptional LysR family regulator